MKETHLEDLGVDGSILLKFNLERYGLIGYKQLSMDSSSGIS